MDTGFVILGKDMITRGRAWWQRARRQGERPQGALLVQDTLRWRCSSLHGRWCFSRWKRNPVESRGAGEEEARAPESLWWLLWLPDRLWPTWHPLCLNQCSSMGLENTPPLTTCPEFYAPCQSYCITLLHSCQWLSHFPHVSQTFNLSLTYQFSADYLVFLCNWETWS